ncbi:hypothetical protein CRU79_19805 [Escherichia sp. E4385]|nr:hypothetical protein CRU79_19805 [Escherichia sp. E4385]
MNKAHFVSNMRRISSAFLTPPYIPASYIQSFFYSLMFESLSGTLCSSQHNIREPGDEQVGRRVNFITGSDQRYGKGYSAS